MMAKSAVNKAYETTLAEGVAAERIMFQSLSLPRIKGKACLRFPRSGRPNGLTSNDSCRSRDIYRSIWIDADQAKVHVIDQTQLPFRFETRVLTSYEQAADAIRNMIVRGAPLIGATAACGLFLACAQAGLTRRLKTVLIAAGLTTDGR